MQALGVIQKWEKDIGRKPVTPQLAYPGSADRAASIATFWMDDVDKLLLKYWLSALLVMWVKEFHLLRM